MDDQQRVVNGQTEADELDHVGHIEHHQEFVSQGIDEGQGGRGSAQGYDERHQDGQGEPQGQGQQHQRHRRGDELADVQVPGQYRGQVVLDGGRSGHLGARDPGRRQRPA